MNWTTDINTLIWISNKKYVWMKKCPKCQAMSTTYVWEREMRSSQEKGRERPRRRCSLSLFWWFSLPFPPTVERKGGWGQIVLLLLSVPLPLIEPHVTFPDIYMKQLHAARIWYIRGIYWRIRRSPFFPCGKEKWVRQVVYAFFSAWGKSPLRRTRWAMRIPSPKFGANRITERERKKKAKDKKWRKEVCMFVWVG